MNDRDRLTRLPIGVFDSGLGGLTVVAALQQHLPGEDILYLGDSARVPYGTRSPETVRRYARNCSHFLVQKGLKMLVVACNTVSALAIGDLAQQLDIPVVGVIRAGARMALEQSSGRRIGVIGTAATIGSGAYVRELCRLQPDVEVFQNAAPLLVPLVEEGWLTGEVPHLAVRRYLEPLVSRQMDVLLLGCTHYPVLRDVVTSQLSSLSCSAAVVDSASAVAAEVTAVLSQSGLMRRDTVGTLQCFVTDLPGAFAETAARFLGTPLGQVEKVDIS